MKILYLVDTFYPVVGGIQNVVDKTASYMSNFADVTVATVKHKNYTDPERNYNILRCKGYYSKLTKDGFGLLAKLAKEVFWKSTIKNK